MELVCQSDRRNAPFDAGRDAAASLRFVAAVLDQDGIIAPWGGFLRASSLIKQLGDVVHAR